ncbi:MAG: DUF3567 domain-containing protein [Rubrivivax sp.]|jgi:hypothetical protein|nr:DUF3567 domain-containing protein [Rubrivivax sp.]
MQMLYNSDSFTVLRFDAPTSDAGVATPGDAQAPQRGGFEIMDKSSRKGIYLQGAVAESFQRGVQALVEQGPDTDALDNFMAGYTALAQQPIVLH